MLTQEKPGFEPNNSTPTSMICEAKKLIDNHLRRLAHTTTNNFMLPEGVTLKDDIMRKTECFLAAKPDNILA